MSEMTVERSSGGGGNVFTRHLGPLPMWGWMAIVGGLVLVYALYKKHSAASSATAADSTAAAQAAGNAPGGVDSSLVPQFINQTYVNPTPPTAPDITVNNNPPATTPPPISVPPNQPPPVTKGAAPPHTGGSGTKPKTVTVTVGAFPNGAGGSPSATASGKNAAWNSTLWGIATHYKVKGGYQALAKLNKIADPSKIYPGEKITVPVSS